ncbi:MAG: hypothetical protein HYR84_12435 [Planctomycetes bacterium]|nr:hypothetical protein [Planctomycetota bacterium]
MMGPIVLTLPLILGAAQDNLPANWKIHEAPEGRFAVAMPSTPIKKEQQVKTAKGELRVTVWIADGRLDSSFVVSYSDYPKADVKAGDEEKRLDQACQGAVEKSRGKLRGDEKPIKLAGKHPGREITIEKDGETIARMRVYLVENRLYQVMVLGSGPIFAAKEKDVGVFLDSFRLIK